MLGTQKLVNVHFIMWFLLCGTIELKVSTDLILQTLSFHIYPVIRERVFCFDALACANIAVLPALKFVLANFAVSAQIVSTVPSLPSMFFYS